MTLLAIIAAAFALTGAPSTPVSCTTDVPLHQNGWAQWAPERYVLLTPSICQGLDYLAGDEAHREAVRQAQPFTYWPGQAGVSALVLLHELNHEAGYHDETDAECHAMAELPTFLSGYYSSTPAPPDERQDPSELATALRVAASYDAQLPANYHGHTC